MNQEEATKAIKEVIRWVKTTKQTPINGIEEIDHILKLLANSSSDIHNVSERKFNIHNCINEICSSLDGHYLSPMRCGKNGSLRFKIKACIDKMICAR